MSWRIPNSIIMLFIKLCTLIDSFLIKFFTNIFIFYKIVYLTKNYIQIFANYFNNFRKFVISLNIKSKQLYFINFCILSLVYKTYFIFLFNFFFQITIKLKKNHLLNFIIFKIIKIFINYFESYFELKQ